MKFRTPIKLVIANCPVSYSKHDSTVSEPELQGPATLSALFAAKAVTQLFTTPFFKSLTRPDASGTLQQPYRPLSVQSL